ESAGDGYRASEVFQDHCVFQDRSRRAPGWRRESGSRPARSRAERRVTGGRSTVPTLPIPLLQDAVARQVARFSLRRVAREVSMSPNGLRDFLRGATPRSSTRGKLERWLAAQGQVTRPPNVGQFVRLLAELSSDLSPQQTEQLGREIAALLVR